MKTLLRSRGFWFGLLGLLMIFGAWWHSQRWAINGQVERHDRSQGVIYRHLGGAIHLKAGSIGSAGPRLPWRRMGNIQRREQPFAFPSPAWKWQRDPAEPPKYPSVSYYLDAIIPHWLLVLIYLPLWGGLALLWRAWKRRRMRIA